MRRIWRRLRFIVLPLLVLFVLVEGALFVFQRKLLYQAPTCSLDALAKAAEEEALRPWPALDTYRGLLAEPSVPVRGTILHLHGNAGSAQDWSDFRHAMQPLGYRLILLEYPGYGARSGSPSEAVLVADAATSVRLARTEFGGPLFLFGESLGSGVAAATAAAVGRDVDGVLLATPWDALPHVAQHTFWFLPVAWLVRDRFDSVRNLERYTGPVSVVMAGHDELIPNHCTRRLYDSLHGPKQLSYIGPATHSGWRDFTNEIFWQDTMHFLNSKESSTPARSF
jgi:uncharacterized protein